MKKFIRIIILTVILSSNAYAKIFSLNCTDSNDIYDKSELKVDTKKKEMILFNVFTDDYVKNAQPGPISKMSFSEYRLIHFDGSYAIGERFFSYQGENRSAKLNVDIKNSKYQIFFTYGDGSQGSTKIRQCKN